MPQDSKPRRGWRDDLGPKALVWGVWLVLALGLFQYVRTYTVNMPWMDEWEIIPALTGHQPVTWKWLWSQHNEHRIVIPRLIYLATVGSSGDFRAGACFDASVLAGAAAAMIVVARRLRGHTLYSDAFFPVIAMHVGQWENLLYSFHIQWMAAAGLAVAVLLIIVQPGRLSLRASVGLAICSGMLVLCGGNGLAFAPACAVMVFMAGWQVRKVSHHGMRATAIVWALGLGVAALTAYYFVDYTRPAKHPTSQNLAVDVEAAMQFMIAGLGPAARTTWPDVQYAFYASALATVVMIVGAVVWRPDERPRAFRLVVFFGAVASLACGMAWARRIFSPDMMFSPRYVTPAAAFWFATYFAWEMVDRQSLRRTGQAMLFALAAFYLVANRNEGLANAEHGRAERTALLTAVQLGASVEDIAARWGTVYYDLPASVSKESPAGAESFHARVKMLKESRFGVFSHMK
jgi:hypothetical protein